MRGLRHGTAFVQFCLATPELSQLDKRLNFSLPPFLRLQNEGNSHAHGRVPGGPSFSWCAPNGAQHIMST